MRKPAEQVKDEIQAIVESNRTLSIAAEGILIPMSTLDHWHALLKKVDSRGRLDGSQKSKHKIARKALSAKRGGMKKATKKAR